MSRKPKLRGLSLLAAALFAGLLQAQTKQEPAHDPLRAEKNIEVGRYYMKRGNYDAAIERFREAIRNRANYALPHFLLAEALEKKGETADAIEEFRSYLQIAPKGRYADDAAKRIEKLTNQSASKKSNARR